MDKAGFFSRFFAWLLDGFVMSILVFIIMAVVGLFIGLISGTESGFLSFLAGTTAVLMLIVVFLFQFLYFGYFWSKSGQTIGMKLLSVKVVRQDGEPLTFLRSALRGTFGYWVSGLIFGLGYLWALIDANNEAWHDKIFETWVVVA
jgi:uncharacterized RDD family membrane protein YckC